VIESAPATPEYVAEITAVPLVSATTRPVDDTVATAAFDDDQVADVVTSWVVPLPSVATALNCADTPTLGTAPETVTVETVVAEVGDVPQAAAVTAAASTRKSATNDRIFMRTPVAAALAARDYRNSDRRRVAQS
jgi:hypothetical protein